MRRIVSVIIAATAFVAPIALNASPASAAKAGQICKAADEGKTQDGVVCKKDGTRFRWDTAPATKAPTSKKASSSSSGSKSSSSKSSSSGSGSGSAVNGRFCAKADDGKRATDSSGRKLVCKADSKGKNRWSVA